MLAVVLKHHLMRFATDAGLLVAAKRRVSRQFIVSVDPHTSGTNASRHTQGTIDIARPHGAAETIFGVVGHGNNLFFRTELDHHGDRPEDFILRDRHIVGDVTEKRRLHEGTVFKTGHLGSFAAHQNRCSFLLGRFNPAENLFELTLVDLRAHLGLHVHRIAYLDGLKGFDKLSDEFVIDTFLHKNAGTGAAHLTLVKENADLGTFDSLVNLTVVKIDIGRLAAEFERCRNQTVGRQRRSPPQ